MFDELEELSKAVVSEATRTMLGFNTRSISFHVKTEDISLIKLGLEVMGLCSVLSLKSCIIGSAAVTQECKNYEETKDWRLLDSFEETMTALN